jgi:hypothetical protein
MIQPKLQIGAVGDKYEQEADRVATEVVDRINFPQNQLAQRQEIRHQESHERIRMKLNPLQPSSRGIVVTPTLQDSIKQVQGKGQVLPNTTRMSMEQAFGEDFSGVRVHTHPQSDQLNHLLHSRAFTNRQNIFFRQGQYHPETPQGQELLAHELTHVVQQTASNSAETIQRSIWAWDDDDEDWVISRDDGDSPRYPTPATGNDGDEFDDQTGIITNTSGEERRSAMSHVMSRQQPMGLERATRPRTRKRTREIEEAKSKKRQTTKDDVILRSLGRDADDVKKMWEIQATLLTEAGQQDSELAGKKDTISAIFAEANAAFDTLGAARDRGVDRRVLTSLGLDLKDKAREASKQAWIDYSDFLKAHLAPSGAVFEKRQFMPDSKYTYFTGEDAAHAIPIVWYKAPTDYPQVRLKTSHATVANFGASLTLNPKTVLGLAPTNNPNQPAFRLKKSAHAESREGQKALNLEINQDAQVLGSTGWINNPMSNVGGFDGDHVKDLGFGGEDRVDNYWPLPARINRRAFNGYNSGYIVHYFHPTDGYVKQAIGGMIGRYFRIKNYMAPTDGAVPDESGEPYAGTDSTS